MKRTYLNKVYTWYIPSSALCMSVLKADVHWKARGTDPRYMWSLQRHSLDDVTRASDDETHGHVRLAYCELCNHRIHTAQVKYRSHRTHYSLVMGNAVSYFTQRRLTASVV
jgi:hypothetical protein